MVGHPHPSPYEDFSPSFLCARELRQTLTSYGCCVLTEAGAGASWAVPKSFTFPVRALMLALAVAAGSPCYGILTSTPFVDFLVGVFWPSLRSSVTAASPLLSSRLFLGPTAERFIGAKIKLIWDWSDKKDYFKISNCNQLPLLTWLLVLICWVPREQAFAPQLDQFFTLAVG